MAMHDKNITIGRLVAIKVLWWCIMEERTTNNESIIVTWSRLRSDCLDIL